METLVIKTEPEESEPLDEHFVSVHLAVKEEAESQDGDNEKDVTPGQHTPGTSGKVVEIYECTKCTKRYVNMLAFREHLCIDGVTCSECHATFKNSHGLEKHKIFHSNERRFVCNYCFDMFKSVGALKSHTAWRHGLKTAYRCKDCMFRCLYPVVLEHHALRCHKKKL